MSLKNILLGCSFVFFLFEKGNRPEVILRIQSYKFVQDYNAMYKIDISITNNKKEAISLPQVSLVYDKIEMDGGGVGFEMYLKQTKELKHCLPGYRYVIDSKMTLINPKETKTVIASFPGSCFEKKGTYKVSFF